MDQVFQALIDRSRVLLDLKTVRTILGHKHRPKYRKRKKKSAEWEVAVERPRYDLTIFKLHCGRLTLKIYTKGERVLRIEAVVHNTEELRCGRSLEKFPQILSEAKSILQRFMNALSCIDQCFIADEMLEQLPAPAQVGKTKMGGVDFNKARMRSVAEAIIALSPFPGRFTASDVAAPVRAISRQSESEYGSRCAAYDLKKLRGEQIIRRIAQTRRYEALPMGLEAITAFTVLRDKAIKTAPGCCPGTQASTARQESRRVRHALRSDPPLHARRLSRTGDSRVNIDNYFVGLRPTRLNYLTPTPAAWMLWRRTRSSGCRPSVTGNCWWMKHRRK